MRILGIDPGTAVTGIGLIESRGTEIKLIHFESLHLNSKQLLTIRLKLIYDKCINCIKEFKPDQLVFETAFYGKNIQSTLKLGQARGVAIIAGLNSDLNVSEYSPREVKKSVVGKGAASKEQVSFMIKTLLNIKSEKIKVDESDALAIALCHAFRFKNPVKKTKDWKSFVEAYPERVIQN